MKRLNKNLLFFVALIAVTTIAAAQEFKLAVNYNTAAPLSSGFREYVSKTSYRGFQGSILYNLNDDFRMGLEISYNDFYQKYERQLYKTSDGADISTVLSNTMQILPILVKGEYSLVKTGWLKPYVGAGAGLNVINYDQFLGEFEYNKSYVKPAFSGDLGLLIPFHKSSNYGARISTSYNFSPFNKEGIKNIDTWNVQAGVVFPIK